MKLANILNFLSQFLGKSIFKKDILKIAKAYEKSTQQLQDESKVERTQCLLPRTNCCSFNSFLLPASPPSTILWLWSLFPPLVNPLQGPAKPSHVKWPCSIESQNFTSLKKLLRCSFFFFQNSLSESDLTHTIVVRSWLQFDWCSCWFAVVSKGALFNPRGPLEQRK